MLIIIRQKADKDISRIPVSAQKVPSQVNEDKFFENNKGNVFLWKRNE
jgi:hypothetical protein